MKIPALLALCVVLRVSASPHRARDAFETMRKSIPLDVLGWMRERTENTTREAGVPHIVVAGDSWADVVGGGGSIGQSFLMKRLKAHGCKATSSCIAIPGTTSGEWASKLFLTGLKLAVRKADYVYIMLGGNDCLEEMPGCAAEKKSATECGDRLVNSATKNVQTILAAIHEANPAARVVGFGYDTMFGGIGCRFLTRDILPQCYRGGVSHAQGNRCFNTEFLKIQRVWDDLATNYSFVDKASILGATQVAGGNTKASTDPANRHIDMDSMGPGKYWPTTLACFHPSVANCGDNVADCGSTVVMEEFFKSYWSKQANVCPSSAVVV